MIDFKLSGHLVSNGTNQFRVERMGESLGLVWWAVNHTHPRGCYIFHPVGDENFLSPEELRLIADFCEKETKGN